MGAAPTFDPGFSTEAMDERLSLAARVTAMCRAEAQLALARADVGILEAHMADEIAAACSVPVPDPVELLREGWLAGSPVIPLLAILRGRLDTEAGHELHRGATSQDIVDTATMLLSQEALAVLAEDVGAIRRSLRSIAEAHRETPVAARTFLQHAGTTTFGARAAAWLTAWGRHVAGLARAAAGLPVQLGGSIGTGDDLDGRAAEVMQAFARRLDLAVPVMPWHSDRTIVAELAAAVSLMVATTASIATDLVLLSQTEVGEVRMRPGGSTSIPGKRNPYDAVHAIAAADACGAVASQLLRPRPFELERASGAWHTEWFCLPVMFQAAAAGVAALAAALDSLEVDVERMAGNLGEVPRRDAIAAAIAIVDRALAADAASGGSVSS
jgi:3-carboxy-cis,cis-muconate cycloisomerase